jgi:hypothetical protein
MTELSLPPEGWVFERGRRESLSPDVLNDAEAAEAALESLVGMFQRVRAAIDGAMLPDAEKEAFRRMAVSRLAPILTRAELARKKLRNTIEG